jgi:hypothetical protein
MQLDFIKRIRRSLDDELQDIQTQILQVLVGKLNMVISKLEKLAKKRSNPAIDRQVTEVKRWKYVLVKQCLDEAIEDLALWQKMFDPSWFLIMKVSSPFIDEELSRVGSAVSSFPGAYKLRDALRKEPLQKISIFLPEDGLKTAQVRSIPFASAKCVQRAGSDKWLVIDSIPCDPGVEVALITKDVRDLARKLSSADPFTFGILRCRGVVRIVEPDSGRPSSFEFVFNIPTEVSSEPRALRSYISMNIEHTLTERVQLAKQLTKSVSYVHTFGFVHKNIRPDNILGFPNNNSPFSSFFLVGFEKVRTAEGRTRRSGDSSWEKNLYRHPQRQGLEPDEIHIMQHDIYSLGVCLLEIGLWKSFVSYEDGATIPVPTKALEVALDSAEFKKPFLMKEHLVALAKRDLPIRMGERYKEVIVNCLTCLDLENTDFGDRSEFDDEDGVLVGVRYIEKVCNPYRFCVKRVLTRKIDTPKVERDSSLVFRVILSHCYFQIRTVRFLHELLN